MPYTTIVAGTTILASWANASVRDQAVTPFATAAARTSAITAPVEGMICYITDSDLVQVYNGSFWVTTTPVSALVATSENRDTATYAALSTAGPAVTVETGTKALVVLSCTIGAVTANAIGYMGFAVSGATTLAADDTRAAFTPVPSGLGWPHSCTKFVYLSSLTGGSNVFTAQYKSSAASDGNSFADRTITVIGIP